ncbi:MAG: indole-3-glycerol phosphate synthase TrpC [Saprospiraceae bacterium]|nr:indole-3-glycerol phosphate synthase TrpC [Saprospiraceae bacterium]
MSDILDKIVAQKRKEVARNKTLYPEALLEKTIYFETPTVSLAKYLLRPDKSGIIAEFKRKSPSKGFINPYAQVEEVSIGYMQAGASALSVLTDQEFFGGSNADLTTARNFNFCPILRKDFTIDPYQIIEAKSIGADAILLIAEVLSMDEVKDLAGRAKSLGLEVLLEMHGEEQLDKICDEIDVVGINNRNLKTFVTSIESSENLYPLLPREKVKISESGISDPQTVGHLRTVGYQGFLIGEQFMKHPEPAKACNRFIQQISGAKNQLA